MSIVFAVLLFSFLIFVHELGHFLAAKAFGVQVNEFALFMGPAIAKWKWGETQYSIRCIPIGGYCAMEGEDSDTESPGSFQKAAWWKRLIILVAGAFMNFIVGVAIVAVVLFNEPYHITPQLDRVESWSTAATQEGLQAGDRIVEFNGTKIRIYEDFTLATLMLPDGEYDITVARDGKIVELDDVPMIRQKVQDEDGSEQMLYGISFHISETEASSVPGRILPTSMNYVKSVIVSLRMLFTGKAGINDVTGPVGIVKIMGEAADAAGSTSLAVLNMLSLGGFIAINLAVMNLLPVPALDGGRVFGLLITTLIGFFTGKEVDPKYEGYIHGAGMILLLIFMALIVFKDIFTIVF